MKSKAKSPTLKDWRERLERQKKREYFDPQAELNILRKMIETFELTKIKGI